jgi:flavin reductase (DIM6/NTAB) family NADH-FMN oxidoreductase RutF
MNSLVRDVKIDREVSADVFKGAMRQLAGAVSVITAGRGNELSGMTVTSVSSLAIDPATLVVSVNRQSSSWPLLRTHGVFGVNILGADQQEVAERFSGKGGLKGSDRFAGSKWITLASGVPLLDGALAVFDCAVDHVVERHSHAIVIGRVLDLRETQGKAALGYWQGRYVALDRADEAARIAETGVPTPQAFWQV